MARSLKAIAHRPSEAEEAYAANLEAEWGQSEEDVWEATRVNMLLGFGAGKATRCDSLCNNRRSLSRHPATSSQDTPSP